jgi:hypothetical protein
MQQGHAPSNREHTRSCKLKRRFPEVVRTTAGRGPEGAPQAAARRAAKGPEAAAAEGGQAGSRHMCAIAHTHKCPTCARLCVRRLRPLRLFPVWRRPVLLSARTAQQRATGTKQQAKSKAKAKRDRQQTETRHTQTRSKKASKHATCTREQCSSRGQDNRNRALHATCQWGAPTGLARQRHGHWRLCGTNGGGASLCLCRSHRRPVRPAQ